MLSCVLFDHYFCSIISSSLHCFSSKKRQDRYNRLRLLQSKKEIVLAICVLFRFIPQQWLLNIRAVKERHQMHHFSSFIFHYPQGGLYYPQDWSQVSWNISLSVEHCWPSCLTIPHLIKHYVGQGEPLNSWKIMAHFAPKEHQTWDWKLLQLRLGDGVNKP